MAYPCLRPSYALPVRCLTHSLNGDPMDSTDSADLARAIIDVVDVIRMLREDGLDSTSTELDNALCRAEEAATAIRDRISS